MTKPVVVDMVVEAAMSTTSGGFCVSLRREGHRNLVREILSLEQVIELYGLLCDTLRPRSNRRFVTVQLVPGVVVRLEREAAHTLRADARIHRRLRASRKEVA